MKWGRGQKASMEERHLLESQHQAIFEEPNNGIHSSSSDILTKRIFLFTKESYYFTFNRDSL